MSNRSHEEAAVLLVAETAEVAPKAAASGPISTIIGSHEPLAAIEDALNGHDFDEVILATRSSRLVRVLHLDLASKVRALGPPVIAIPA